MGRSFRGGSIKGFIGVWVGTVILACMVLSVAFLLLTGQLERLTREAERDSTAIETAYRLQTAILYASRKDMQWRRSGLDSLRLDLFTTLQRAEVILYGLDATATTAGEREVVRTIVERFNRFFLSSLAYSERPGGEPDRTADSLLAAVDAYREMKVSEMDRALKANYTLRNTLQRWLIVLVVSVVALITAGSVILFRRIIRPVIELSAAAERFGRGDLGARARVERKDELGNLALTFNNMADDIDRREKTRLEFSAAIFHDIKNPLVIIGAAVRMLRRKSLPKEQADLWLGRVIHEVDRIEDLTQDLMDSVQIESGQFSLHVSELDFCALVAEVCAEQSSLISSHSLFLGECGEHRIIGDRRRLERAIINILSNAVKYSPEGTTITIRMSRRDSWTVLRITDQGVGISPEDQAVLFQPFGRLSRTRDMARGTGLGLYIVKRIVDAHRGSIRVESRLGEGTTVEIALPLA